MGGKKASDILWRGYAMGEGGRLEQSKEKIKTYPCFSAVYGGHVTAAPKSLVERDAHLAFSCVTVKSLFTELLHRREQRKKKPVLAEKKQRKRV